ncbi:epsin-1-like isoform X2 [Arapaima gigas]
MLKNRTDRYRTPLSRDATEIGSGQKGRVREGARRLNGSGSGGGGGERERKRKRRHLLVPIGAAAGLSVRCRVAPLGSGCFVALKIWFRDPMSSTSTAELDGQPVAMSTSSLRRQVKNIVHNYSEAEIKVREATSNDPWGPSSSLMSEIADLTYNVVAFSEIMSMVWKRLNDHGKNWRHVYKAMTLMEYLIKTGSERVAQQCRENIYAVQTLKDFQYIDRDGKDQGVNVREKAKQLVTLLKDEERLREERIHALKTKEKMAQTSSGLGGGGGGGGGGGLSSLGSHTQGSGGGPDTEQAWPQSSGEEDLQLQLALAMSKEEAEQSSVATLEDAELRWALSLSKEIHEKEERLRRGDDLRLQMAIEESKREKPKAEEGSLMELSSVDPWGAPAAPPTVASAGPSPPPTTTSASATWGAQGPWGGPSPASPPSADPWGAGGPTVAPSSDPWGDSSRANSDPWGSTAVTPPSSDPWGASAAPVSSSAASDPWGGDGGALATESLSSDPWGGPAKHTTNGTGRCTLVFLVMPVGKFP